MASFNEVYENLKSKSRLTFELQKTGKNKGAVRVRTSSGADGEEALRSTLPAYGWEGDYDSFMECVRNDLAPKPKKDAAHHPSIEKLSSCTVDHPSITGRRTCIDDDLTLLRFIRFVSNSASGRLVLVQTGEEGAETGNTFSLVSTASQGSGSGFASALRSALAQAPATSEWYERKINEELQAARQRIRRDLEEQNSVADEPLSGEVLDEVARKQAESERGAIEREVRKCTRMNQCNDGLSRILARCSHKVFNQSGAYNAFIGAMASRDFPLLLCRSKKLRAWYTTKTTDVGDKTITETIANSFDYDGDYVDLVAENLEYLWELRSLYVKMPAIYTNDNKEPCFRFFDLEKAKGVEGDTSAWNEFTARLTGGEDEVFKAFVWSIFDAKNRGRQCLYILDRGYSGKSAIINAISDAIGVELHAALSKDSLANQFAYSKVWDKRFVTIGDNKNKNLIRSQAMHSMLGGDIVDVEHKGKDPFPARLMCKVLVASNVPLQIDVEARNEYSRVLAIAPDDSEETLISYGLVYMNEDGTPKRLENGKLCMIGDPTWEGRLKEQFHAFLSSCYPAYLKLCPRGMDIVMPEKTSELIASFDDDRAILLDEILETYFDFTRDANDFMPCLEMQHAFNEVIKSDEIYKTEGLNYSEWKEFLRRRYGLEAKRPRSQGSRRGFYGIRQKCQASYSDCLL